MKILLADDHPVVRIGIRKVLLDSYQFAEITEVDNGTDLEKYGLKNKYDVIVTDLSMPGTETSLAIRSIKSNSPKMPIIVVSMNAPEHCAIRLFKLGISAYLTKENVTSELIKAVEHVMKGNKYITPHIAEILADSINSNQTEHVELNQLLTNREYEIFKMIASGKSTSEIGNKLLIKGSTISSTKAKIIHKMHVHNGNDLIRYAIVNNIVT